MKKFRHHIKENVIGIVYQHECVGSSGGQVDMILVARDSDGKGMGYIDYSIYEKEIHIKMIGTIPTKGSCYIHV